MFYISTAVSTHTKKGKQTPHTSLPTFLSWDWERVKREVLIRGCYPWSLKINLWSYYLSGLLQVPKGLLRKDQNRRARALRVKHKKNKKRRKEMSGLKASLEILQCNLFIIQMINLRLTEVIMLPKSQTYLWSVYLSGNALSSPATHNPVIDLDWWIQSI